MGCGSSTDAGGDRDSKPASRQTTPKKSNDTKEESPPGHCHPLQVENWYSNSWLVVDDDENVSVRDIQPSTGISREQILTGCPHHTLHNPARIVRIFTSSTFTDTKHERNSLMERAYPKLKAYCHQHGYEFQVVDMRWGVREEAQNDHRITELCIKEIKACQQLSTGPNFVTFLSHKYGYRPLQRVIEAEEFETITRNVTGQELERLEKWYIRDENAVPTEYVLQPITVGYPDLASTDPDKARQAKEGWYDTYDSLQQILATGAEGNLTDPERIHLYQMSVTESEIREGILSMETSDLRCLWFKRNITDIHEQTTTPQLARYAECYGSEEELAQTRKKLNTLKSLLSAKLTNQAIMEYDVQWTENAIDPRDKAHESYISQLCNDFEKSVTAMTHEAIQRQQKLQKKDNIYQEVLHHAAFARTKCAQFQGRADLMQRIKKYVKGKTTEPLVISGDSGSGKTSLIAMAVRQCWEWMESKAVVICRFIGTTQDSSSVRPLLISIIQQLYIVYNKKLKTKVPLDELDMRDLNEVFTHALLHLPQQSGQPLVLLLDSLDQLDITDGGQQLEWLPRDIKGSLRLLLSTLPQANYGCLQRCRALYPEDSSYLDVPSLDMTDVESILQSWLGTAGRQLTRPQYMGIVSAFKMCPLPLLLKLSVDEAVRWHSYDPVEKTRLYSSVSASISGLLQRVENTHGKLLVSYALAYLTAAKGGLTEAEMEDLLSLCEEVLDDVYQFWTPPMRRLPPLLWVRIKSELEQYLVNRGTDGVQVIYWYHRQFIETSKRRYLQNETFSRKCHKELAEFFMGIWADKPKPYDMKKDGSFKSAVRHVTPQPLQFSTGVYNLRKLNHLPYHLGKANEHQLMRSEVVCNYDFLLAKIIAVGLREVFNDLKLARLTFPRDKEIAVVLEALQLAEDALTINPHELAGQLVGRIHSYEASTLPIIDEAREAVAEGRIDEDTAETVINLVDMLEDLLEQADNKKLNLNQLLQQARQSAHPVLVPHMGFLVPPGSQLMHQIAGHFEKVYDMDITSDGKTAATASADRTVKLWNIKTGQLLQTVQLGKMWEVPQFVHFYPGDELLVVSCTMRQLYIIDVKLGAIIKQIEITKGGDYRARPVTVCMGKDDQQPLIVTLRPKYVDLLESPSGKHACAIPDGIKNTSLSFTANEQKILLSFGYYIVYACYPCRFFFVLTVNNAKKIGVNCVKVFDTPLSCWDDKNTTDHIATMELIPHTNNIVLVNGLKQDVLIYDFQSLNCVRKIAGNPDMTRISKLYYSLQEKCLYCSTADDLGILDLSGKQEQWSLILHHSCDILDLKSVDGRLVVTMAEDNILRIWDRHSDPFKPDLSVFTGKVSVSSNAKLKSYQDMLDTVFDEYIREKRVDTKTVLTTKEVLNYWTDDTQPPVDGHVRTKLISMANHRYIAATQNIYDAKQKRCWTKCFTIWDMRFMKCVRRIFLPHGQVFMLPHITDDLCILCALFQTAPQEDIKQVPENGKHEEPNEEASETIQFKWLNLTNWETSNVCSYMAAMSTCGGELKPPVVYKDVALIPINGAAYILAVPTSGCEKSVKYLRIAEKRVNWVKSHFPEATPVQLSFQNIQVTDSGLVLGQWGGVLLCMWDLAEEEETELEPKHTIKLCKRLTDYMYKNDVISVSQLVHKQFVLVTGETPNLSKQKQSDKGAFVVSLDGDVTGNLHDSRNTPNIDLATGSTRLLHMRHHKTRLLQLIVMDPNGKASIIHEVEVGLHANRMISHVVDDVIYAATWCASPREKTVRYWKAADRRVALLGTFTADEEVADVCLVDDGKALIINSSSGLIKLFMQGRDVKAHEPKYTECTRIYPDNDLNVECAW